jgi:hypothetical protein
MTQLTPTTIYAAAAPPPLAPPPASDEVKTRALAFVVNYAMGQLGRAALERNTRFVRNPLDSVRNIDQECDFPRVITPEQYSEMDERQGLGARVNGFWTEECWASDPEIYEDAKEGVSTPWEEALAELIDRHNLFAAWERLDRNAGIGEYGGMLYFVDGVGKDDKPLTLEDPAPGVDDTLTVPVGQAASRRLLYLRVFPRHHLDVLTNETTEQSPRYGQPTLYNLKMAAPGAGQSAATSPQRVHWSWIIHVPSDDVCSNEWTGHPRTMRGFNYLLGARKILSGDGEAVYKGGFPGIMFEADAVQAAAAGFDEEKQEAFKAQVADYMAGLKRSMLNIGIKANQLTPGISDPTPHLEAHLKMIGITIGAPWRVLVGSEVGQLASEQDTKRVARRTRRRCEKYCTPRIVRQTLDRFMMVGVLPGIAKYDCDWPDPDSPSDKDKSDIGLKVTQALALFVSSGLSEEMTLRDYLVNVLKWPGDLAKAVEEAANAAAIAGAGADAQDSVGGADGASGQQGDGTAIDGPPVRQR